MCDHKFSMMLRSGLLLGHNMTSMAALCRKSCEILAVCGKAPSCIKMATAAST